MKISFLGADQCVTGSCHCVEANGKKILIDCGLQQGRDEISNGEFPFAAGNVDCVLITHAHIDHSGRVPMLLKHGFTGKIITTRMTAKLLRVMLQDSAHIHEQDAEWQNRKGKRSGKVPVEPLYTVADALAAVDAITTCEYHQVMELYPGITAEFVDAGHLLGSACIILTVTEGTETRKIVFSGDLGNIKQPIIRDPACITGADYVVIESTYGDRNHGEGWSYTDDLAKIIDETIAQGGNVIIPSFAVGRTQELLYFIREIKDQGLVKSNPDFPVYIDSPLAREATEIFVGDLRGYLDEEALELVADGTHMFNFSNLRMTTGAEDSKALNTDQTPKVIISASGMCDAGRIRHHLKHNLWRPECTVVFVGFQGEGTLGRHLLEGAATVKLFGEEIAVRARLVNYNGLSSHADRNHLIEWVRGFTEQKPRHIFVVHGDREVAPYFAKTLTDLGYSAHAPQYTEEYDLIDCRQLKVGYLPERKLRSFEGAPRSSSAYQRLVAVGQLMTEFIRRSKGRDNKTLAKFADQLKALLDKWEA